MQGTNDSGVLSKVSAVAQGYFLVGSKGSRRAPLINRSGLLWGYYVRWRAVDHCVKQFLQVTESCPRRQVWSLGAGFDSLYFRLRAEGRWEGVVEFELDFPDVARCKAAVIWLGAVCVSDILMSFTWVWFQRRQYVELRAWNHLMSLSIITENTGCLTCPPLYLPPIVSPIPPPRSALSPLSLVVTPMPGELCVEGLGMASTLLGPGLVLLSGGSGRGGVQLYDSVTSVPRWGAVVFGGSSSPLHPIRTLFRVSYDPCDLPDPVAPDNQASVRTSCLCLEDGTRLRMHWVTPTFCVLMTSVGPSSACPYEGGVVICGGLGRGSVPLGDTVLLGPTTTGFCWERLQLQPPLVPRYSQCAHVIGNRLVLVGGVWLQDEGVPGVAVTDLTTGGSSAVPWPLMLHSFCSELLDSNDSDGSTMMALIGGGGNCFSFRTHHNPHAVTVGPQACSITMRHGC
ncbi:unnamed protein product [Coregonus sp. 'balchen']|nr:unnamed protein product [Coregonus sp. 'balchen']